MGFDSGLTSIPPIGGIDVRPPSHPPSGLPPLERLRLPVAGRWQATRTHSDLDSITHSPAFSISPKTKKPSSISFLAWG